MRQTQKITSKLVIAIICCMVLAKAAFPQNITNTLGTSGLFTVKDNAATFLTLTQSSGLLSIARNLELAITTSSTLGVLTKGGARFLHNYEAPGSNGDNTFLGINSGNFTMSGGSSLASYNTGIGYSSLKALTTGYYNTSVGYSSMFNNSTGYYNTAVGSFSLYSNSTGFYNTALGMNSLVSNIGGNNNTAVGNESLHNNSTGNYNTAVGRNSLYSNSIGLFNTAMGYFCSELNTSGQYNTAVGSHSLHDNSFSSYNTAVGFNSLYHATGDYSTAVGYASLYSNTVGNFNTAVGSNSLYYNTTGDYNTAVGIGSLNSSDGNNNTALGYHAGYNLTTGSNCLLLGYNSQPSTISVSNQITLGDANITSLRCNTQTISSLSDARDKDNVKELPLGLDFLMKLKPRQFNWDRREWYENGIRDGSKMLETPTAGFIAQELDEVQTKENAEWLNLVLKDNPEKLEATYGNLLPVMVKAIQELKTENDELKERIIRLEREQENIKVSNK